MAQACHQGEGHGVGNVSCHYAVKRQLGVEQHQDGDANRTCAHRGEGDQNANDSPKKDRQKGVLGLIGG